MVFLTSYFDTIRAVAGQRDPVILEIVIRNTEEEAKLFSFIVRVPFSLGFDNVGLMRETRRRLGYVKAGNEKVVPIPIYCKKNIKEGLHPIEITAYTHPDKYDKVLESATHKTQLRVIKV